MIILRKEKKLAALLSVFAVVTLLSASCGNREADNKTESQAGASGEEGLSGWQEQYDLGIRLLGEGKYEEAVIAFAAAIEIEPKRAAAYVALADAYVEAGKPEEAEKVLADVPDAIRRRQEEIQELLQVESEEPEPETELNEYGAVVFQQREYYEPYEEMTPEKQAVVNRLTDIAVSGEVQSLAAETAWGEEKPDMDLYTEKEGYRIRIRLYSGTDGHNAGGSFVSVEVREENGSGYVCVFARGDDGEGNISEETFQTRGSCKKWQWEGAVTTVYTGWFEDINYEGHGDCSHVETGMMKDGLREGDFVRIGSNEYKGAYYNEAQEINETEAFHRGVHQVELGVGDGSDIRFRDVMLDAAGLTLAVDTIEYDAPYLLEQIFW
ncbi:MAG: tetratricopeptide repeat protein [Lachnospiraceae bacterium]|nr:tetratricopeptide repeat protein [Lachnospiraceae bacterium]